MRLEEPISSQVIDYAGAQVRVLTYVFTYSYESPTYPQNVRVTIYGLEARNPSMPVVLTISFERPDGRVDQLYF